MQTILGATGQIAVELARELAAEHSADLRLVSRHPRRVNPTDELRSADLLDPEQTRAAVRGSEIVYFTAGVPTAVMLAGTQFPVMLRNALDAARATGAKFAYFDNTYMYPQDDRVQTEETPFAPNGPVGRERAAMSTMVLEEMARGEIPVLIARAPEFYGPGRTQGYTNSLVVDRLRAGRRPLVPVRADRRRSLIWTPDASRGLAALGTAPDAYGQTWHLPIDGSHPTYREFVATGAEVLGTGPAYTVVPGLAFRAAALVRPEARILRELLPRYAHDNLFSDAKFRARFPEFAVTSYREGFEVVRGEAQGR